MDTTFELQLDPIEPSRAIIAVGGGYDVNINRTAEGIIVDVWSVPDNHKDDPECLGTISIADNDWMDNEDAP